MDKRKDIIFIYDIFSYLRGVVSEEYNKWSKQIIVTVIKSLVSFLLKKHSITY